jgi:hypothetical protein
MPEPLIWPNRTCIQITVVRDWGLDLSLPHVGGRRDRDTRALRWQPFETWHGIKFYTRLGFEIIPAEERSLALAAVLAREVERELDPYIRGSVQSAIAACEGRRGEDVWSLQ